MQSTKAVASEIQTNQDYLRTMLYLPKASVLPIEASLTSTPRKFRQISLCHGGSLSYVEPRLRQLFHTKARNKTQFLAWRKKFMPDTRSPAALLFPL